MTRIGIRTMFSLVVYLQPMSDESGWSRAGISNAMTLDFLPMGVAPTRRAKVGMCIRCG
jgi:hypothetical protein